MGDTFARIEAFASAYRDYAVHRSGHGLENCDDPIDFFGGAFPTKSHDLGFDLGAVQAV
jgi:hypothetical protein